MQLYCTDSTVHCYRLHCLTVLQMAPMNDVEKAIARLEESKRRYNDYKSLLISSFSNFPLNKQVNIICTLKNT